MGSVERENGDAAAAGSGLQDATSRAQVVARVATHFMTLAPEDYDAGIQGALRALGTFAGVDRAYVFRIDEDGSLSNTHEWCATGIDPQIDNLQGLPPSEFPWFLPLICAGRIVDVPRTQDLPPEADAERREFEREGIRSLLCVPLASAGRIIGFLGVDAVRRARTWTARTVELLKAVGGIVNGALVHKHAQLELRESRARLQHAQGAAGIGLWAWDLPTGRLTFSDHGLRILDLHGTTFDGTLAGALARVHADDAARVRARLDEVVRNGRGGPLEFRVGGEVTQARWVRCEVEVVLDAQGAPERVLGVVRDVTERQASEESRRRLSTAVEQVADGVLITDADGVIRYVNPAFERITGHRRGELVGRDRRLLRHPQQDPDAYQAVADTVARGEAWSGRLRVRRRDGSAVLLDATASPVHAPDGTILDHVAVLRDVTREAELEEHLRQGQKMEAVGMLAGGIAHDFNNLLIAIIGHSDLLLLKRRDDDDVRRHADEIRKAGDRAKALTSQLLSFSRKQVLQPRALDLGQVLEGLSGLLRRLIGEDVDMLIALPEQPVVVQADPGQMEQVVMNLVTNARDAMPAGGRLHVELGVASPAQRAADHVTAPGPDTCALLSVRDSGIGMDEATQARIFEPFYTTKDKSRGTGLGLATVYGVVRQCGGAIRVESAVGRGSTFRIYLPTVEALPTPVPAPETPRSPRGDECILVVEDDAAVANIVRGTLASHGYRVLYAENGRRALDLMDRRRAPLDLLFTDVVMPVMGGVQLAAELELRQPGLRVLYTSGYTDSALLRRGQLVDGVSLLQKPYSPAVLVARIREALDVAPPPPTNGNGNGNGHGTPSPRSRPE